MSTNRNRRRGWVAVPIALASLCAVPAQAETPEPPPPAAGYEAGFFVQSADGKNRLEPRLQVQTRFTWEQEEVALDEVENRFNFAIQRLRVTLGGNVLSRAVKYKFQADFGRGFVTLKDALVDLVVHDAWFVVRVGQFKRPFSRQQLASSGRLELVDRAITDKAFGGSRDLGVMLHNGTRNPFEWAAGIFNGTGETPRLLADVATDANTHSGTVSQSARFTNVPTTFNPTLVVRAGYNHGGIDGYAEGDLEGGDARFAVAASAFAELDGDDDGAEVYRTELDAVLKLRHFSLSGAGYLAWDAKQNDASGAIDTVRTVGAHAQLGYVLADLIQPVARYALVDRQGDANTAQEITVGVSVYFYGHSLKWQTEASTLLRDAPGETETKTDFSVRSQLQLAF